MITEAKTDSHRVSNKGKLNYCDQVFYEQGIQETKELVATSARTAGLTSQVDRMDQCGQTYSVSRCQQCNEYWTHPFHCDERICPTCYYRNLFRFLKRHRQRWSEDKGYTQVTIDYGTYSQYMVEGGLTYAATIHKDILKLLPFLRGGIYHIQLIWDNEYNKYHILYQYLINGHQNWILFIGLAIGERARVHDAKYFNSYRSAERHFVRHACQYPADILLDYTKITWYLTLMKRKKLIQGFGALYDISGGRNRGNPEPSQRQCLNCGGQLRHIGIVPKEYVFWDNESQRYLVDPGAPGLQ